MINAVFYNDVSYANTHGLWQYDYGQVLRIQGLSLPAAVEIHFSLTEKSGQSVSRIGVTRDEITDVVIPDSFLENGNITEDYSIFAFIYLTDDKSGQTEYKIKMNVQSRPRPEAFDKPEDAELFKEAIKAVNDSADRAEDAEKAAKLSQDEAQKAAKQAAQSLAGTNVLAEQMHQDAEKVNQDKQAVAEYVEHAQQAAAEIVADRQQIQQNKEDAAKLKADVAGKLDKQQGVENAGKALVIGEDGNVVPGEMQSGGGDGIAIINTMSGASPLVIPDSAERVNKGLGLVGNTEQANTTGVQLFDVSELKGVSGFAVDGEEISMQGSNVATNKTLKQLCPAILPGKYFLSIDNQKFSGIFFGAHSWHRNSSIDLTEEMLNIPLNLVGSASENIRYKLQIQSGAKATPYEPYTGGKTSPSPEYPQEIVNAGKLNEETGKYEVQVKVTGKNLYDEEYAKNIDNWMNAYAPGTTPNTYSVLPIYVGDATEVNFSIKKGSIANPAIVIGASLEQYGNMQGILYHGTNSSMSKYSFVLKPTGDYVYLRCNSAAVKDRLYIGLETQIEISNVRTSYQPYKEQTLTLTSDRPITKWDKLVEKDGHIGWLYGGKTIQSYNSEPIDTEYMSSTGSLTVGATVLYKLKTTEFIPLHQSEQNAIRALTTYYPTTVITADGGEVDPFIEVTYTADTKNYIDQKISAINKAIINTQKALL